MRPDTLTPITGVTKKMGPKEFLRLVRTNRSVIARAYFVAPRLGSKGMGYYHVKYNYVQPKGK